MSHRTQNSINRIAVSRHVEVVLADLDAEPTPVVVTSAAVSSTGSTATIAANLPTVGSSHRYFFEIDDVFATAAVFATGISLHTSLAYSPAERSTAGSENSVNYSAAFVLMGTLNLYLMAAHRPEGSTRREQPWVDHVIPLDASVPWRIAGQIETDDPFRRIPIDVAADPLATPADIQETLDSLASIRIRGCQNSATSRLSMRDVFVTRRKDDHASND